MDKGAHFFNCDFQVHTPRDLNWGGEKYGITPDEIALLIDQQKDEIMQERYRFANDYLEKARENGLDAIAITDHHDVVFAKIIRKVAEERNREFIEAQQYDKCITVFPGMELTLSNPACQCLIIFDADFPDSDLDSVVNFLGLNPNNEYEKSHAQVCRISEEINQNLEKLHKRLDELGYCKGRYIIFPNVNKSGQFTILRQGFNEHYSKMPCVGGYVDKEISTDSGYLNKLNGGDHNYGNKAIGVVSTSDNRYQDGRLFGHYSTWVKWEEPTAEALRQACLARESRISQESPELPQIFISRLEVTNSKFMGSFVVEFNNQYNALIGGRGTGKSTILEYLRWGLCDQTDLLEDIETKSDLEKRRQILMEKTLIPYEGEVRITFIVNGIIHVVKRNSVTKGIQLKIGSGNFEQVKEEQIRTILPIQGYSQKQLSNVGVRTDELKRFIQQPIVDQLGNLSFQLIDNAKKTRSTYSEYLRKKDMKKEKDQLDLQIRSLKDQVSNLRVSLKGISEYDQKIIAIKQPYDNEQNLINQAKSEFSTISDRVSELIKSLTKYPEPFDLEQPLINTPLFESIDKERTEIFAKIKDLALQLQNLCKEENQQKLADLISEWGKRKAEFQIQYEAAKNNASANRSQLNEIQKVEKRLQELSADVTTRTAVLKDIGNPEEEFNKLRDDWFEIHQQKLNLLVEQSQNLTTLSKGGIKAEYSNNLDISKIKEQITLALQGTRIRDDKLQVLCDYIKNSENSLTTWNKVLNEFKALAEIKITEESTFEMPVTPILTQCDFSQNHVEKIASMLTPEKWLDLALVVVEFTPDFKYSTNNLMGDTIPFSDASAGQQATALLTVLLNQPGNPLVIDQPEDDIDNRAIRDIINNIWDAKKRRQIIFTSHNANIVVNGDAELVICCDYLESENQTRGQIKAEGAIDSKIIKAEITSVMEGGEKAFRLRKDKYGF
ncbi:TrlF family AAA-like ATPase [Anaerotignum sp.]|uniref:TrlF family AAA-like ATPase n=1 Tax=Anaerotignum sp. TaxID=2039241 RepID=UPI00289F20E7|nr:AAA family ATPase [Anaerotignum sp.]